MAEEQATNPTVALQSEGVKDVLGSGSTAMEVARGLIPQRWSKLAEETKMQLAIEGLARLINDGVSKKRAADSDEFLKPYRERIRQEREDAECREAARKDAAGKQAAAEAEQLRDAPPYKEEIERVHELMMCPCRTHRRDGKAASFRQRERCVLRACGGDPRLLPPEKLAGRIEQPRLPVLQEREYMKDMFQICHDLGYEDAIRNLRSITLIAADGTMKSLFNFNTEDVRQWKARSESNRVAWGHRSGFFQKVDSLLTEHDQDCLSDLPVEAIKELAAIAEEIWKRKPVEAIEE